METVRTATAYKFTASVVMAIQFMMQMLGHIGKHVRLKGTVDFDRPESLWDSSFALLPKPTWCHFDFFSRILAMPIRRKSRHEPNKACGGYWIVEREIHFEYMGVLVAKLWLYGHKSDGLKGSHDNNSFWEVSKISYAMMVTHDGSRWVPSDWKTFEFEVIGTSGTSCMFLD